MMAAVSLPKSLTEASAQFSGFVLAAHPGLDVVLHDSDADGLAAGVLLAIGLSRLGRTRLERVMPDRNRSVWTQLMRERLSRDTPACLYVLDLGVRAEPVVPGVPTCYIDHHAIDVEDVPSTGVILSSYRWKQSPNTSLLTWQLCHSLIDMSDRNWLAAIGTIGDLGRDWTMPPLTDVRKKYRLASLREIVSLVNAARRVSVALAEEAGSLLAAFDHPDALLQSTEVAPLRKAKKTIQVALDDAKRSAPVFAGSVALVRMRSPYQVHPLVAQIWRSRLKKNVVIAANEHYLPGLVNFSVRGPDGMNVREFLRRIPLPPGDGEYARGHDAASGGSLPVQRWNLLLELLGFPPAVHAREEDVRAG
jgi:single-stranded-DNA-specific exonuclease